MSGRRACQAAAVAIALAVAVPGAVAAQATGSPDQAVRALGTGWVSFILPMDEEVEICTNGMRMGGDRGMRTWTRGGDRRCTAGAGRIRLRVEDGEVRDVEMEPADTPAGDDRDLGTLTPEEGSSYLLRLARTARESVAEDALPPAFLARDVEVWPELIALARDRDRPEDVRQGALFWVGQAAGERVAGELRSMVLSDEDVEIRNSAVFALSQMDGEEGVDALLEVARSDVDGRVRKSAFFWLAQTESPRAIALFEEILRGGG